MDKISKHNLYVNILFIESMITLNLLMWFIRGQHFGTPIDSIIVGVIALNMLSLGTLHLLIIHPLWVHKKNRKVAQ